MSATDLF